MNLFDFWKNLSIGKKLYVVVGAMALLIATELLTLLFAMNTLSSVRAFVGGEGLWSKAQKNAVHSLYKYASSHNEIYYQEFLTNIEVPLGDRKARLEMQKPRPDPEIIREGFLQGRIHPDEIDGMVKLITRFHKISYLSHAISVWRDADENFQELIAAGARLHELFSTQQYDGEIVAATLQHIDQLNSVLTSLEDDFSYTLGAGSRWLENLLMMILFIAVLTIESCGLFLTISFSRTLSRGLNELNEAAYKVGRGDFTQKVPVRSRDELGQLAYALNKMTADLDESIGGRKQAEQASQSKNLFLANMSHEIRTPLGAILGFTELLKDPNLPTPEKNKYLEIIERTGHNLTQIINDVLDISKIEAGHLDVEKIKISLPTLLSDIYSILNFRCSSKPVQLKFVPEGRIPEYIFTDPIRLRQVLMNIVGNAIKFTEAGIITVTYRATPKQLLFEVDDTGIGIAGSQSQKLFQPFIQADNSVTRKYEGTGLGLVISRHLAQALGGDVRLLHSQPGQGSTFLISIALETTASAEIKTTTAAESGILTDSHILLVEDSLDNQLLVQLLLKKKGALVDLASNGREGLNKALSKHYDIVLMDMQMPILDGYSAAYELRTRGYKQPIIALTAHAMKDDKAKCLAAGCDDYLTKPIDSKKLTDTVRKYTKQKTSQLMDLA